MGFVEFSLAIFSAMLDFEPYLRFDEVVPTTAIGSPVFRDTVHIYSMHHSAADLGMFSMFGRTEAPEKGAPQKERQIFACRRNRRSPSEKSDE